MSLIYQRIRLELESSNPFYPMIMVEQRTRSRPRAGAGRAIRIEIAVVKAGVLSVDVGDLISVTLVLKPLTAAGVINGAEDSILEKTTSTINPGLTAAAWNNDVESTPWHAAFAFADLETAVDMTDALNNELTLGMVVTGLTSAGRVTLGSGLITFVDDGAVITGGTPPVVTRTMTDQEIIAMLSSKVGFTGNPAGARIDMQTAAGKHVLVGPVDESGGSVTFKADEVL